MAAAAAPTMVCFLDVDPSFEVARNAIRELQNGGRLQDVCTVKVKNSKLRSASGNEMFGGPNGFSRTLGSTLRAFMLRSAYLEDRHDPDFDGKSRNIAAETGYSRIEDPELPSKDDAQTRASIVASLKDANNKNQAKEISANFDRLYPHFHIENKLEEAGRGRDATIPGMMVIVELQGGAIIKLHTINVTVRAKCIGPGPANTDLEQYECPEPSVVRITSSIFDLPEGKTDDDFPHFQLLKRILNVNKMSDENITALLKKLDIQDEREESNDEDDNKESDVTSCESTEEEQRQQEPDNE